MRGETAQASEIVVSVPEPRIAAPHPVIGMLLGR
jgi:hypothetical protein